MAKKDKKQNENTQQVLGKALLENVKNTIKEIDSNPLELLQNTINNLGVPKEVLVEIVFNLFPNQGVNSSVEEIGKFITIEMHNAGVSSITQAIETPVGSFKFTIEKL